MADDLATGYDGEINRQTIPEHVWHELTLMRQLAHTAPMHRGHAYDVYGAYLNGVADALYINRDDLATLVALG